MEQENSILQLQFKGVQMKASLKISTENINCNNVILSEKTQICLLFELN